MPDESILSHEAIEALRTLSPDDPAFLRELIEIYLQDTPLRLTEIDTALAKSDGTLLTRAAHSIKGSSGNFGASTLAKLAQEIEGHGKTGNFAAAAAALPGFKAEFARVKEALTKLAGGT